MKILVTGGNGQLGMELRKQSIAQKGEFVFTDIHELDLLNRDALIRLLEEQNFDLILNSAAYTAVDNAETDQEKAYAINQGVPAFFSDYVKNTNKRIIHISTDYVFPGDKKDALLESDRTGPKSSYGKSKLAGEEALNSNPNAIIVRTAWLYSAHGKNFVKTMLHLMKEREEISVVNDQVGSPTFAGDLACALLNIIEQAESNWKPGIYHYANKGAISWYDFAVKIREFSGLNCQINAISTDDYPTPAPRPASSVLNTDKIVRTFGVTVPGWEQSLKNCIEQIIDKKQ